MATRTIMGADIIITIIITAITGMAIHTAIRMITHMNEMKRRSSGIAGDPTKGRDGGVAAPLLAGTAKYG